MGFLTEAVIYMASAVVAVPVFKRLGLGSVLGYLAAGVAIGPTGFALIHDPEHVLHFAELGVVLLMFVIGLELEPARLWRMRTDVFGLGGLQVVVTAAVITGAALGFDLPLATAITIGLGLALSSTAFALQILAEKNELPRPHGRRAFAVLLFQDLAVIPILAIVPLLAGGSEGAPSSWQEIALPLGALVGLIVVGHFALRPLLRIVASAHSHELTSASGLLLVTAAALLMEHVGLSMALGAFVAGTLLAESEFRHELEANIEPFKGLLLGLFFIAVGMSVDLGLLVRSPMLIAALVLALLAIKIVVLAALGRAFGLKGTTLLSFAVTLGQGGEFAFVIFALAGGEGLVGKSVTDHLVMVVTLSMALTPLLFVLRDGIEKRVARLRKEEGEYEYTGYDETPVIIAGFGRFGQIVSRLLTIKQIPFTALENNIRQVDFVREYGGKIYYGDPSRLDLLRAAKAGKAKVFVLAVDDVEASVKTARVLREHFPHLTIFARARNRRHAHALMAEGIEHVFRETYGSSLETARNVLQALGLSYGDAHEAELQFREHDERVLREQFEVRDDEEAVAATAKRAAKDLEKLFERDETR